MYVAGGWNPCQGNLDANPTVLSHFLPKLAGFVNREPANARDVLEVCVATNFNLFAKASEGFGDASDCVLKGE